MNTFNIRLDELSEYLSDNIIPLSLDGQSFFVFNNETMLQLVKRIERDYLSLCQQRVLLRPYYNLCDDDADKCITIKCFQLITTFKSILTCLQMLKGLNVRYLFLRRHSGETEREVHAQQEFITKINELFKTFENKKLVHLPELCKGGLVTTMDLTKYLHILRHKWPIMSGLKDDNLIELLSESFCLSNVEQAIKQVYKGVTSLSVRSLTIENSGQVESVSFSDGSSLPIKELYFKSDTNICFFITKIARKMCQSAKVAIYGKLVELLEDETKFSSLTYWIEKRLPSSCIAVLVDLFIKERKLTNDQLKLWHQKLTHDILTPPTYIINLLTYINWRIENLDGIYYKSKLFDANLSKNITQIIDNDTIKIHDQTYHFSPYLVPSTANYANGLHRSTIFNHKQRPVYLAYQMNLEMAENYASLIGLHIIHIDDSSTILQTAHDSSTLMYIDCTKVDLIRQLLLDGLNNRAKESNVPVDKSKSDTIITQKIDLIASKSSTDQIRVDLGKTIRLCVTPNLQSDMVIDALTLKVKKQEQPLSTETIRAQLDNFGLSGTRLVEKRLTSILSIVAPHATISELDLVLHKARSVFDVITERNTPTSSTSRTSNTSLSSSTSRPSRPLSERSEALSMDYSTKLTRAKHHDVSLAIALYNCYRKWV